MIKSEMKNELMNLEEILKSKAVEHEKSVYTMFANVARQCFIQLEKMSQISEDTLEGQAIIGEIVDLLKEYVEMPFNILISKGCYEEFDDLIAELDDWIEGMNEILDNSNGMFLYMESWDMGVFFE